MERLNQILARLKNLESCTGRNASTFASLTEIASFMDDLPDITQQLETSLIDIEEMQDVIRFYGDEDNHAGMHSVIWEERGKRARELI